jgi:hypothetical protein
MAFAVDEYGGAEKKGCRGAGERRGKGEEVRVGEIPEIRIPKCQMGGLVPA